MLFRIMIFFWPRQSSLTQTDNLYSGVCQTTSHDNRTLWCHDLLVSIVPTTSLLTSTKCSLCRYQVWSRRLDDEPRKHATFKNKKDVLSKSINQSKPVTPISKYAQKTPNFVYSTLLNDNLRVKSWKPLKMVTGLRSQVFIYRSVHLRKSSSIWEFHCQCKRGWFKNSVRNHKTRQITEVITVTHDV